MSDDKLQDAREFAALLARFKYISLAYEGHIAELIAARDQAIEQRATKLGEENALREAATLCRKNQVECEVEGETECRAAHIADACTIEGLITPEGRSLLEARETEIRERRELEIAHGIICIAEGCSAHIDLKPADGYYNVTMALCNKLIKREQDKQAEIRAEEAEWWAKFGGQPCTVSDMQVMSKRLDALRSARTVNAKSAEK